MKVQKLYVIVLFSILCVLSLENFVLADPSLPLPFLPISGDQDNGSIIFQASGFDLLTDVKTFLVPGEGPVNITYDFVFRGAAFNNEFGFFPVDDVNMKIDELNPGDPNYLQIALSRAKVIFPSGSTAFTPDTTIEMSGGEIVAFFIVQNGTLAQLLANNRFNEINKRPVAFFSIDPLNPDGIDHFVGFRNLSNEFTQFGFEDLTGGGDLDYDDITYNIQIVLRPSPAIEKRDIVFIRGIDSEGTCDGFNKWVKDYFSGEGKPLVGNSIENYYNFNYAGGGNYPCPDGVDPATKYYEPIDTCDGIVKAAGELRNLIEQNAHNKVTIVGWSMGGVVASFLVGSRYDTDPEWVKQNIASVITFDSPHQGVIGQRIKDRFSDSACGYNTGDPQNRASLQELSAEGSTIQVARNAALIADGVVPFYTIDAKSIDFAIEFIPREWVVLTNARPFFLSNSCYDPSPDRGCEPPRGVKDNHDTVWFKPETMDGLKKGPLVACAVMAPDWGCDFIAFALKQDETVQKQVEVSPETLKMRFVNSHGGIPNAIVAASALSQNTVIRMRLVSPDGTIYGPDGAGPIAGYSVDDTSEIYDIANPAPGMWTIELKGVQAPEPGIDGTLATYILERSEVDLNVQPFADAGDIYTGTVGIPITLFAIGSWDPDGGIVQFEWDIDNDGNYDYITDTIAITHTYHSEYVGQVDLRVTDNDGNVNTDSATITVTSASQENRPMLVSSSANGRIAGLKFSDEDILYFDPNAAVANRWKMYFDGSDVGVSNTDIDALEFVNEGPYGALLLSFDKAIQLPVQGRVADADIVKFTYVAPPGPNTSGFFSSCFIGSAFDLTSSGEDIDALAFDAQGRMLISVDGTAKVNGTTLTAKDEDLLLFSQTPFVCNPSSGSWSIWVDGSNLALTSGSEDLNSAWVDTASASGTLYMSTKGNYVAQSTVNTTSGDSDDLFGFAPSSTGENTTAGFLSAFFDGDLVGFTKAIDGLYILPTGSSIAISAAEDATENAAAVEQFAVEDQSSDAQDEEIDEFDEETEGTDTELFLPFITR